MEGIMNEENDLDFNVEGDAVDITVDYVCGDEVLLVLNKTKLDSPVDLQMNHWS